MFISGEHGSVWRISSFMYWFNRWAYRRADMVVTNSNASKTLVCHKYGVDPQKVKVIYNIVASSVAVDRAKARAKLGLGMEIVVGSIGRLAPQKGYTIFVDAARQVLQTRSDIKFLLIGGGEQEQLLRQYVRNLGIERDFILTGWREDARDLLPTFDIFVSTSIYEPFGNVFIEAAMAGVPVIGPRVDGVPEAVKDGITGKLLRPVKPVPGKETMPSHVLIDDQLSRPLAIDPEKLAETIIDFVDHPDMRRDYGKAGQKYAKSKFTITRYVSELQQIYSGFISELHSGGGS